MTYLTILLVILGMLWISYGYFSVNQIEKPKYTLVSKNSTYEIRAYHAHLIASVEIKDTYDSAATRGFRQIANYIFGNNHNNSKIAMTAPVIQEQSQQIAMTAPVIQEKTDLNTYRISFVMPSEYTIETIASPKNKQVTLKEISARKIAVRTFSGIFSVEKAQKELNVLKSSLQKDDIDATGKVSISRYNPPATPPFMNRHEIWIELVENSNL